MLKKKQKIRGIIDQVMPNGLGTYVAFKEKVYMKNVLVGEEVEAIVTKKIKDGYFADVIRVVKPSSIRCKVKCDYFGKCGSCNYLHLLYPFELKQKTQEVKDLVAKKRMNLNVQNCVGMKDPFGYRNKLILTFSKNTRHETISGFYEAMSHRVVNINHCLLHDDATNKLIVAIKQAVKQCRLDIYEEQDGRGFLKHVLVRKSTLTNEWMIVLVTATKEFRGKKNFIQEILKKNKDITTIIQNINPRNTSVVLGNEEITLYGKGYIQDELCNLKFNISSKSFYQINHSQCELLYTQAISLLHITKEDVVIDTYSGIGTISLLLAQQAKAVYGVEINENAVQDAKHNAKLNDIENVEFICQDAGEYMQQLARENKHIDAVVMDPARDGSDEAFLQALLKLQPKKIVYISCNPETQIRDLAMLQKGYTYKDMYLFDMFPKTNHVETVVLLSRKSGTPKLKVSMKPESESNYTPEEKATYQKIKDYIKEKYDVNVHTSNIAEVKRMCGIDMRENYNKSKKENPKINHCTEEKVGYIKEALEFYHF